MIIQRLYSRMPPAAAGGICILIHKSLDPLVILFPALFCLALLIVSILPFIALRRFRVLLSYLKYFITPFLAGAFIVSAAADWAVLRDTASWTGLPVSQVRTARILLIDDARPISGGRWVVQGRLKQVMDGTFTAESEGRVTVFGKGDHRVLTAGFLCRFSGRLTRDGLYENTPFVFSAETWESGRWRWKMDDLRHRVLFRAESALNLCSTDTASFLAALLLGRKADAGSPIVQRYRESGCMHLLALSGFHLGLIAMAVRIVLKPLAGHKISLIISMAAAIVFLWIAGIRPSLLRAVGMYCLWAVDTWKHRKHSGIQYLAAVFMVQAVIFPYSCTLLSFRLSYAALAGLLVLGSLYHQILNRFLPRIITSAFGAGFGAQIATLPIVAAAFGVWRPVGLAAAPLLTPPTALAMGLGSLLLILPSNWMISGLIARMTDFLIASVEYFSAPLASVPALSLSIPVSWLIAAAGAIIAYLFIWKSNSEHSNDYKSRFPSLDPRIS